jgi:predicted glutamine amidotransferase
MCKVFALTNSTKVKVDSKFIGSVRDAVCKTNDKDGFGYASISENGLTGERTTNPFEWLPMSQKTAKLSIVANPSCNSFGDLTGLGKSKAFIGHGRFSTNSKRLENTHPFINESVALIHNGVVSQVGPALKDLKTDCDTEILFKHWIDSEMHAIEDQVTGYYAMAILDSESGYLHIVRDSQAQLYIAWSPTIDSFVIATTAEIIGMIAYANRWAIEAPERIGDNQHIIFSGNEIVSQKPITPLGRLNSQFDTRLTSKALGLVPDRYEGYNDSDIYSDPYSDDYLDELEEERYTTEEEKLDREYLEEYQDDMPLYRKRTG